MNLENSGAPLPVRPESGAAPEPTVEGRVFGSIVSGDGDSANGGGCGTPIDFESLQPEVSEVIQRERDRHVLNIFNSGSDTRFPNATKLTDLRFTHGDLTEIYARYSTGGYPWFKRFDEHVRAGTFGDVEPPNEDEIKAEQGQRVDEERRKRIEEIADYFDELEEGRALAAERKFGRDDRVTRLLTVRQLREKERPPYLVEGIVPGVGIGQIFGRGESGKSLAVLDLSLAIASGRDDWLGKPVLRQGPVIYVLREGEYDFDQRVDRWAAMYPEFSDEYLYVLPEVEDFNITTNAAVERLEKDIAGAGVEPVMIVIDTQAQSMGDADENSNSDMSKAFKRCRSLAQRLQCLVMLIHHTGYDESHQRGGSSQFGDLDVQFQVSGKGDLRTITMKKNKYGPKPDPWQFHMGSDARLWIKVVTEQDGDSSRSAFDKASVAESLWAFIRTEAYAEDPWTKSNLSRKADKDLIGTQRERKEVIDHLFKTKLIYEESRTGEDARGRRTTTKVVLPRLDHANKFQRVADDLSVA